MKKLLIVSVLAFCCVLGLRAQDVVILRMDRQQMGLRGMVASMDEDILLRKDYFREDWPERKWFVKDLRNVLREDEGRIVTFNQSGRMLTITYTQQGKKGLTTTCSYASNGLLSSYLGEGYKVEARYNGNNADINVYAETKDYKTPNLAKADLNNTPYTNSYPFDLKCRQELTEEGLPLRSEYFYVDSMPAKVCEYSYNHNNLLESERIVEYSDGGQSVSTVKYTYDNKNFLVKKVLRSRALEETVVYENNENGDCTKMTVERPYGTVVYTFEYVYDTMQNWTVRLQFEDGVFDNAALRTLTYHKATDAKVKSDKQSGKKADKAKPAKKAKADKPGKKDGKESAVVDKKAAKAQAAAAKQAEKEAKARRQEEMKAQKALQKEAEKSMTKEQRKALQAERKALEKAAKEQTAAEKKAAKEMAAAEKRVAKEYEAAKKKAEKERAAAEKKAKKERKKGSK